jgi:hypothetical protein
VAKGKIAKLSKGKFYKPETSKFGALLPLKYQVVKDFIDKGGKLIECITEYSVYNELLLTTQIADGIQIGQISATVEMRQLSYFVCPAAECDYKSKLSATTNT